MYLHMNYEFRPQISEIPFSDAYPGSYVHFWSEWQFVFRLLLIPPISTDRHLFRHVLYSTYFSSGRSHKYHKSTRDGAAAAKDGKMSCRFSVTRTISRFVTDGQ